ncbi:MAG: glycoside hydrolase family 2 TIM barrel-domain containing protein [Clostridia bacterium]
MQQTIINKDWFFKFGENLNDEDNLRTVFCNKTSLQSNDILGYYPIGLPHSFGIPYYGESNFYVGYGCYFKNLQVTKAMASKQIILEFGAVFQVAEIYVNGKFVALHEGGYTAFICDVTSFVVEGDNLLFVRVNNLWKPTLAPRAGEHTFNGGVYRDVKILLYEKQHISWYGTFVKCNKIESKTMQANSDVLKDNCFEVVIETETENCQGLTLKSSVKNSKNVVVASVESVVCENITTQKITLTNCDLWSVETPTIYTLLSEVGKDNLETEFGVRFVNWDKDKGFFLNGKRLLLQGANVHQDHGGWADAVTHSGIARDVQMMKECGFNFIRGSHYPHHTQFAKECDKRGMLFWSEGVFWGIGGFGGDGYWDSSCMPIKKEHYAMFENSLKQTMAEMIKTNRNSPSIICWSIGNEIFFSKKEVLNDAKALIKRLIDFSHQLDSSRSVAIGGVQRGGLDILGDIAGYNGDGAVLFKNPPKPNMVAEYGSIASFRPGKFDLYETAGSNDYFDWRAGRCIWCGFHHGSIADIGNLGIVDLYRLPLNAWFAYRQKLLGIAPPKMPISGEAHHIKLWADRQTIKDDGTEDAMLIAQVYNANNERVNGHYKITFEVVSGGAILPTGKTMEFSEPLKNCFNGACAMEVRGYFSGETTICASAEGLVSGSVTLQILGKTTAQNNNIIYPKAVVEKRVSKNIEANLIENRPITVSSELVFGSSEVVTSNSKFKFWAPAQNDNAPSITLDLEHCYNAFNLIITKAKFTKASFTISTSLDKQNWVKITQNKTSIFKQNKEVCVCENARYVKIEFEQNNIKICKIKINQI